MVEFLSKSEKRLIVEVTIEDKQVNLLVDTGASVGILDMKRTKKFVRKGRPYHASLVGAGGSMDAWFCNSFAHLGDKVISQFLIADIDNVMDSVERETGLRVAGILSLPQMKVCGIQIDANDNKIIIE